MITARIRRWLYSREIFAAMHVSTFGDWWAARAAARLRGLAKFFAKEISR